MSVLLKNSFKKPKSIAILKHLLWIIGLIFRNNSLIREFLVMPRDVAPTKGWVSEMLSSAPKLSIVKILPDATVPKRAHPTDSGLDLHACRFEKVYYPVEYEMQGLIEETNGTLNQDALELSPGMRALIHTGISATVGPGYEIQIRPRSGLALKQGLTVLNTPGTVDESFRGPICVILINQSGVPQTVKKGDRVAQMVVCPVSLCDIEIVQNLNNTSRNAGGFGSTGV